MESVYGKLRAATGSVPAHNVLVILGDFNARLGPENAPFTHHSGTNTNGKFLAELMTENELLAATFEDRSTKTRRQLDYILVRRKWRNCVLNAEPYNSFHTIGSDHRIVFMKIRLSLRPSPRARYDWKAFSSGPDLQAMYTVEVCNRFQMIGEEDPSERYQRFIEANEGAMKVEKAHQSYSKSQSEEDSELLKEARQLLYSTYDRLKEEEVMENVRMVQEAHGGGRYGEAWKVINEVTGRRESKEGQVTG